MRIVFRWQHNFYDADLLGRLCRQQDTAVCQAAGVITSQNDIAVP